MSEFPPDFNYDMLLTEEDLILRKLALSLYSQDAVDYIAEKYRIDDSEWSKYQKEIQDLIDQKLPECDFIKSVQYLNFNSNLRLF